MTVRNKILFIIYTPYMNYLPKRLAELTSRAKLDGVDQIITTPQTYQHMLTGLQADTVHLIKLHPDNTVDPQLHHEFFDNLEELQHLVEMIKTHNKI